MQGTCGTVELGEGSLNWLKNSNGESRLSAMGIESCVAMHRSETSAYTSAQRTSAMRKTLRQTKAGWRGRAMLHMAHMRCAGGDVRERCAETTKTQ